MFIMKNLIAFFLLFIAFSVVAQQPQPQSNERPKLVVGIIVDQMRQEYLYRFGAKFGEGGFKRMMNNGFMFQNAHYNYVPTLTAPGHASVYTGTTPAVHGIIGNAWYDKDLNREVYCVSDPSYKTVGSKSIEDGQMSPNRLLSTTITDELKLSTQKRSKVISVSIKDRGAVLPGGHMADGAYWYDENVGKFITSTFYMKQLPPWVEKFNELNLPDKYLSQTWNTSKPIDQYIESGPDDNPYEIGIGGKSKAVFPYNLAEIRKQLKNFDILSFTPFSDDYLTEMAKAAIDGEKLGADEWTDFLCVSFSAPDKLGHAVGPNAIEEEDLYIRLDKNLEDLFKKLDQTVGEGNYLVFLSADHAIAENPQYLIDSKVPAGSYKEVNMLARLTPYLQQYFPGKNVVESIINDQVYFNNSVFSADPKTNGVDLLIATELTVNFLMQEKGVANVFPKSVLRQGNFSEGGPKGLTIRGYNAKRSGDIAFISEPGWIDSGSVQGTTHGSVYTYDTHVPILFFGKGIKKGTSVLYHPTTDIAATLAILLKTKFPSGCTGQPMAELFD
jgi:predicted AlkP superfamily pyrophosphatase or phosphodiesterase